MQTNAKLEYMLLCVFELQNIIAMKLARKSWS